MQSKGGWTKINFVKGISPGGAIGATQGTQSIVSKTIPGLVLNVKANDQISFYTGVGVTSFVYPANLEFNVSNNSTVERLERKEDFGYKLGVN